MLRDDEIVEIMKLVDFKISKSELGAFFRKEDHPNYVECGDQILRNFLNGLVIHLRGTKEHPKLPGEVLLKEKKIQKDPAKAPAKRPFKSNLKKEGPPDISYVKYKNKKKS